MGRGDGRFLFQLAHSRTSCLCANRRHGKRRHSATARTTCSGPIDQLAYGSFGDRWRKSGPERARWKNSFDGRRLAEVGSSEWLQVIVMSLTDLFPNLVLDGYRTTSEATTDYNCIAWAGNIIDQWWWTDSDDWPSDLPREETVETFVLLFEKLEYSVCSS